jgi:hypothetical protein
VPRLFFIETSNILRKRYERRQISADDARATAESLAELPWNSGPITDWSGRRWIWRWISGCRCSTRSTSPWLFASRGGVVTADRRLVNALQGRSIGAHVLGVEELDSATENPRI